MLTAEEFRRALAHWGATYATLPLRPVTHEAGRVSESAMYAGDALILKVYRDEATCLLAAALADALQAQGIPASCALPLPDGGRALPVREGLWIALCRLVPGKPLRSAELILSPQAGRRIGKAIAGLHRAADTLGEQLTAQDEPYTDRLLRWALPCA